MAQNPPFTQPPPRSPDPVIVSKVTGQPVQRPSDFWLKHPGWIDHVAVPPHYYVSIEEIEEVLTIWGHITGIQPEIVNNPRRQASPHERNYELDQAMARISPTPVPAANAAVSLQQAEGTQRAVGDIDAPVSADELHVVRAVFNYPPPFVPVVSNSSRRDFKLIHSVTHSALALYPVPPSSCTGLDLPGGKTYAASILKDEDFEVNRAAIFRKKQKPEVTMEFSANDLEPFRIQDAAAQALANTATDENQELPSGTHAAGDATKHDPPNIEAFDGDRTAIGPLVKPRGRGRRSSVGAGTTTNNDLVALLVGALLPTLGRKRARSESSSPRTRPDFHTPPRASTSTLLPPFSPLPAPGNELDACLAAFLGKEGIDFLSHASTLLGLDLTPDVIPVASDSMLTELLETTIGKVLKLKLFCESWTTRQGKKQDVFT
ncbi:hypothetical protein EST38_g10995 [Candolleomyces aberdarensis]|uniref:Uncharacterized protein n=1 Tax=Candolleomyces aberdarensis TaxID=2316362 RepID=A0A4V1Q2F0_9AGAR|nr:hypothetical protein EST38_g10995 [Candolleomyces aberdarensis]